MNTARDIRLATTLLKRCPLCGDVLPVTEFHHNPSHSDGLDSYCRDCSSLDDQARRATGSGIASTLGDRRPRGRGICCCDIADHTGDWSTPPRCHGTCAQCFGRIVRMATPEARDRWIDQFPWFATQPIRGVDRERISA